MTWSIFTEPCSSHPNKILEHSRHHPKSFVLVCSQFSFPPQPQEMTDLFSFSIYLTSWDILC